MPTLNAVLDIAKNALLTNQKAISVTSHNISNASTPGYTRQRASLEAMDPIVKNGLYFGTGVNIQNIERVYDGFLSAQLRGSTSLLMRFDSKKEAVGRLEAIFNDFDGTGLSSAINGLFNSFQDVANNPESYAERSSLLSNAGILADSFNNIDAMIRENYAYINNEISASVEKINLLAGQMADYNRQIIAIEAGGVSANDLKDKRDEVLKQISELMDISTLELSNGSVDVLATGSFALVTGTHSAQLETFPTEQGAGINDIRLGGVSLNSRISGGALAGLIQGADAIRQAHSDLNYLSASLAKEINLQHRQGWGLDASTNNDFFSLPAVYAEADARNAGGAQAGSAVISDLSLVTLDDYEIRFAGPASYSIYNSTTRTTVASGAYVSGNPITFDGLSVTISDGGVGPAAGDIFEISVTKNAALTMGVELTDKNKVAAASSNITLPGGNTNALAMAGLRDAKLTQGASFGNFYAGIVSDIGFTLNDAKVGYDAQSKINEQLGNARESISGVSLEEEAVNLMKLQKAYEAAAKVMTVADEMLETLLSIR